MASLHAANEGKWLRLPGRSAREIVSAATGAQSVTIRHVEIGPRDGTPERGPHVHTGFEECIYVLSGTGLTETEGTSYPVTAGDCVVVPSGELHVTRNTGTEPLVLLCFFPVAEIAAATREFASWDAARAAS
jgi:mannose-6-phosphate isomerase-like protein (cupin superfamily)